MVKIPSTPNSEPPLALSEPDPEPPATSRRRSGVGAVEMRVGGAVGASVSSSEGVAVGTLATAALSAVALAVASGRVRYKRVQRPLLYSLTYLYQLRLLLFLLGLKATLLSLVHQFEVSTHHQFFQLKTEP